MPDHVRRDSWLTVLGLALLTGAFVLFFYLPGRKTASALREETAQAEQAVRDIPLRLEELASLERELARRKQYLAEAEKFIPTEANQQAVIQQIAQLAAAAGVSIPKQQPMKTVEYKTYRAMPFRISLTGSFTGICSFLRGLEQLPRLFSVEDLKVNPPARESAGFVEADLIFSVYVRRSENAESEDQDDSSAPVAADRNTM